MNRILFGRDESLEMIAAGDPRAVHLQRVLRGKPGRTVRIGRKCGGRGEARIEEITPAGIRLALLEWTDVCIGPAFPLRLILGMPRPLVAKRLLKDLSVLMCTSISLFASDLSERSYRQSTVWRDVEPFLTEGASQGGHTLLPTVRSYKTLLDVLDGSDTRRAAVLFSCPDNEDGNHQVERNGDASLPTLTMVSDDSRSGTGGEKQPVLKFAGVCRDGVPRVPLFEMLDRVRLHLGNRLPTPRVELVVGSERGFSDSEVSALQGRGYQLVDFGPTTLRTESAAVLGCAAVRSLDRYALS